MATFNTKILVPSVGVAWTECVKYWEDWVTDEAKTVSFSLFTGLNARGIRAQYVLGADTYQFDLHCLDIFSSATTVTIAYVLTCPGFRHQPKVMLSQFGARVTKTHFEATLVELRKLIFSTWCTFTFTDYTIVSAGWGITGLIANTYMKSISVVALNGVDVLYLNTKTAAVTHTIWGDRPPCDGLIAAPINIVSAGGGGGGITDAQVDRIVAPLEDMSLNRYEVEMNHGAVVVTASNGSVIEP